MPYPDPKIVTVAAPTATVKPDPARPPASAPSMAPTLAPSSAWVAANSRGPIKPERLTIIWEPLVLGDEPA